MFRKQCGVVLFVLLGLICDCGGRRHEKLRLSVYYESKGISSKEFIFNQLKPAMEVLKDQVSLQFIPFGNATMYFNDVYCPHGRMECLGNVVHDCAFRIGGPALPDEVKLNYVLCEMTTMSATRGDMECVREAGISVSEVERCAFSYIGGEIQRGSKYLTDLIKPRSIPSIALDEEYEQKVQDEGMENLLGMLCSRLKRAAGCAAYFNQLAFHQLLTPHAFTIPPQNIILSYK